MHQVPSKIALFFEKIMNCMCHIVNSATILLSEGWAGLGQSQAKSGALTLDLMRARPAH